MASRRRVLLVVFIALSFLVAFSTGCNALPGAGGGQYVIGASLPLTGQTSFIGEAIRKALELKVEQVNAAGGVNGHQLKLVVEDDQCDPTTGVSIAQRFLTQDNVVGMFGPACSAVSVADKETFQRAKVVDMTVASTADAITQGTDWSFQMAAPDSVYATTLATFAADHYKRVAVINDTSAFGLGAYGTVEKVLNDRNVKAVDHEQITAGQPDITPQALNIKQSNADFVIGLVLGADAAHLCQAKQQLGIPAQLAGQTAWSFPNLLSLANGSCEGALFTDPYDPNKPEAKAFLDAYQKKWNERPQYYFPAAGWDAITIWLQALEQAGSRNSNDVDQQKLLKALESVKGYRGAIGVGDATINFGPGQHVALKADGTHMRQIKGDQLVPFNP